LFFSYRKVLRHLFAFERRKDMWRLRQFNALLSINNNEAYIRARWRRVN